MSARSHEAKNEDAARTPAASDRADITGRVLLYFRQHANAMDSVDGIARFWVHEDRSAVAACLADLQARGLLERHLIAGTEFFSLPRGSDPAPAGAARSAGSAAHAPAGPVPGTPPPGPAPLADATPPATGAAAATAPRGRLLLVDDDPSVRRFMVEALSEAGHSVAAAEDGERAIEMVRADRFDLVITDLMMPGISGLEVLRKVRQVSPATEVIVITAHASLDTAIESLRCGAYDFITKPLEDLDALHRVVARALERRRLSADNHLLVASLQERNRELRETVARLAAVNEIGRATTGLLDLQDLYQSLVRLVAQHLKARRVSVLLSEQDSETMMLVASVGILEPEALKRRVRLGEGIAGRVAAAQTPLLIADIDKSDLRDLRAGGRYLTRSFMVTPLNVTYPIRYQRRRIGVINVSDKHSGEPFTDEDLEFLSTLAAQVAVAIENARLVREMEEGYLGALVTLIQAAEDARPSTRGHSKRVAELAVTVARDLDLPEARVQALVRAAALHQVGRLVTGPARHGRGRQATDAGAAWSAAAVMATERILAPIVSLREAREVILHAIDARHAAGVPTGAEPSAAPIEARILSICEEYVRLTGGNGQDPERARRVLETLGGDAGRRHDRAIVAALGRAVKAGGAR